MLRLEASTLFRCQDVGVCYTRNLVRLDVDDDALAESLSELIGSAMSLKAFAPDVKRCVFTNVPRHRLPPGLFDDVRPAGSFEARGAREAEAMRSAARVMAEFGDDGLERLQVLRSRLDRLVDRTTSPYDITRVGKG